MRLSADAANLRLRQLGYSPNEARVEPNASPTRLIVRGALLGETAADADDMAAILAMLPTKAELLAFRAFLRLDEAA